MKLTALRMVLLALLALQATAMAVCAQESPQPAPAEPAAPYAPNCPTDLPDGDEGAKIMAALGCSGVDYMLVGNPRVAADSPGAATTPPPQPLVGSGQGQPLIDNPDTSAMSAPDGRSKKGYDYGDLQGNVMYRAGMADALHGVPMNKVYMEKLDYLRGYADGQRQR